MKKLALSLLLIGSIVCSTQIGSAKASDSLKVGSKKVAINSTITANTGNGYTGSDGTVYAKVSVKYTYKKSGKTYTKSCASEYKYRTANAACKAASGGKSVKVVSTHEAIYKGDYNHGTTSAYY